VAERLYAKPSSKAFGALSVRVQYLADCELIYSVPAKDIYPAPKVDSAIVRLQPKIAHPTENPKFLDSLVKLGFAEKRKMLRNNLKSIVERDRLTQILEQLEIDPQVRAEDLSVQQWVELSHRLTVSPTVETHEMPET
ncbi:MAG TPA: rRNA adenine dimethyltransferase family protein, partial [Phormidium sp.]